MIAEFSDSAERVTAVMTSHILFMHDDGYSLQTLAGAEDKCGGFQGYRPYWQAGGLPDDCSVDRRFWTVWERVDGSPEIWPAVIDDFGTLRSGRMVRAIAQERSNDLCRQLKRAKKRAGEKGNAT